MNGSEPEGLNRGCGRNGRLPVSDGDLGIVFETDSGHWRFLPERDGERTIVIGKDVITCRREFVKKPLGY